VGCLILGKRRRSFVKWLIDSNNIGFFDRFNLPGVVWDWWHAPSESEMQKPITSSKSNKNCDITDIRDYKSLPLQSDSSMTVRQGAGQAAAAVTTLGIIVVVGVIDGLSLGSISAELEVVAYILEAAGLPLELGMFISARQIGNKLKLTLKPKSGMTKGQIEAQKAEVGKALEKLQSDKQAIGDLNTKLDKLQAGKSATDKVQAPAAPKPPVTGGACAAPVTEKPSLVDAKGQKHILEGDGPGKGGGHRPGTGKPGKSEFPPGWSDGKILGEVSDIATDPAIAWTRPDGRGYITGTKTVDGVNVKVVVDTVNGRIVTGFPTNLPRNP
jgi:hypothetical protein